MPKGLFPNQPNPGQFVRKICDKCGLETNAPNYLRHYNVCNGLQTKFKVVGTVCPHCQKEFVNGGLSAHIWRVHTEEGKNHNKKLVGHKGGNQFTTNPDYVVSEETRSKLSKLNIGRILTADHIQKIKVSCSLNGQVEKAWRGRVTENYVTKLGEIVYLQSSYEVAIAKSLDENNIVWTRPSYFHWMTNDGFQKRYYPDFYLPDYDVYLDPKNEYLQQVDAEKIRQVQLQNNIKVLVLSEYQLSWNVVKELIGSII